MQKCSLGSGTRSVISYESPSQYNWESSRLLAKVQTFYQGGFTRSPLLGNILLHKPEHQESTRVLILLEVHYENVMKVVQLLGFPLKACLLWFVFFLKKFRIITVFTVLSSYQSNYKIETTYEVKGTKRHSQHTVWYCAATCVKSEILCRHHFDPANICKLSDRKSRGHTKTPHPPRFLN